MITESITLRKLTYKSVLWFGKYADRSVQQIIDLKDSNYLTYIYFCIAGISFVDEILEKLSIKNDWEIQKPGIDLEKHKLYIEYIHNGMLGISKIICENRHKSRRKAKLVSFLKTDKNKFTKGNLQSKNHGH